MVMGLQGKSEPGRTSAGHQDLGRAPHDTSARHHKAAPFFSHFTMRRPRAPVREAEVLAPAAVTPR
jgi:hypothetical protein